MANEKADAKETVAKRSTRGVLVIAGAKAYFMVTGFAQPILLTRLLGAAGYGVYGTVLNAVSILNNVVVAGSIQAMSHSVTEHGSKALRKGLVLHGLLGIFVATVLLLISEPLGREVLGDPQVPPLLRIAAIVAGDYSVYAALVGALNGKERFTAQAGLDITFATLRTGLIVGGAATAGVTGAITGFAIASALIIAVALWTLRREPPDEKPEKLDFFAFSRAYLGFFAPVLLYQLALNLVLQADLLVLKALLVRREGLSLEGVNTLVGVYKSVQNFAFLPYQLLLAVTFVAFPIVSKATLEGDVEATRSFVQSSLRFSVLALGAMLSVLVGMPESVLRLAFPAAVAVGAPSLRLLSLGQGAFAMAVISATILLAAGRTRAVTLLMIAMLGFVFAGDYVGISMAATGPAVLSGAAGGTAAGCVLGCALLGMYVKHSFGVFLAPSVVLRTLLALTAGACSVAWFPYPGKLGTLGLAVLPVVVYLAVLVLSGAVSAEEREAILRRVRKLAGR